MLPKLIIIMRQVLHTGVLILIHFKTQGQVFSNQRSMMQGTKILCFNLQLILFLNLVINIEGFQGFKLDVFHIGVIPKTLFNQYSCKGERQINSNKINYYELRNVSSLFSLFGGDAQGLQEVLGDEAQDLFYCYFYFSFISYFLLVLHQLGIRARLWMGCVGLRFFVVGYIYVWFVGLGLLAFFGLLEVGPDALIPS